MSVKVSWMNPEQSIILQKFEDPWTVEEHRKSLYRIGEMVAHQAHTVHSIADMTESQFAPGKLMVSTRVAENIVQPNTGLLFIVRPSPVITSVVAAARRFMPRVESRLRFVDTVAEACEIIAAHEQNQYTSR
ncbi:MAG: hypothetical protein AAGK74_02210 [Chloroflexota bacterium]